MWLKRLFIFLLIIILLGILSIFYPFLTGKSISNSPTEYSREQAFVTKIIDGDTIETNLGTIRLLGINTPEKNKPYYQEAKDYLIKELQNKTIELLRDKEDIDRYKRKLRYVFSDDKLINIEIVQQGLATTFMLTDLKYKDKFKLAENFAMNSEVNLWKKSKEVCATCIILVKLEPIQDFFIIKNNCNFECNIDKWVVKDDANHFFELSDLQSGEAQIYQSKAEVWNDEGDRFFMRDEKGNLVIFYEY